MAKKAHSDLNYQPPLYQIAKIDRCGNCVNLSGSDLISSFSACPLCTRLGLQDQLNTTLTTLKDAQETADTVSNLEELWPELINVEGLITEAQVRFSCFRMSLKTH